MTEDKTANRFRDMDELKYSVRSVAQYARGMFDRIHILTTEIDPVTDEAQVPSWLNLKASRGIIELVHHDQIFEKAEDLPSFNSLSIESQIHHVPGVTDVVSLEPYRQLGFCNLFRKNVFAFLPPSPGILPFVLHLST